MWRRLTELTREALSNLTETGVLEILGFIGLLTYMESEEINGLFKFVLWRLEWWLAAILDIPLDVSTYNVSSTTSMPLWQGLLILIGYLLASISLVRRRKSA